VSVSEHPPSTTTEKEAARRSKRERTRTGAIVVLVALIVAFAFENLGDVKVDWIFGSGKAPLIVVIVVSLLVGILITYVAERRSRGRS
jgi:uncharacterized integral membrane protein